MTDLRPDPWGRAERIRDKIHNQISPGCAATGIGVRDPRARLRPLRRMTARFFLGVDAIQLLVRSRDHATHTPAGQ